MLIIDESYPAKCFKSDNMINRATSRSEPTLHVSKQVVGLEIPDKSTIDHSFHGLIDATCQRNRTIIGTIRGFLTRLWNRNYDRFPAIRKKVNRNPDFIKKYLKEVKEKHQVDASVADSVFHLALLKYHGLYVEHPATLLNRRACCILQHHLYSLLFSFLANRCKDICAESRGGIMREVICQCVSNVTMRRDISCH